MRPPPSGFPAPAPLPSPGSRVATAALVVAFVGVLAGLTAADRAVVRAEAFAAQLDTATATETRPPIARRPSRLRLAIWGSGLTALAAVAIGLLHERRLARRIAERSAELERLSAELIRVNRAKSEFLANVSHELRTPLNAIVGFVEMLNDGVYGELPPRQAGPVQRIASSATHLRHLVDQILDLAKIAAGRLEVHADPIDLRPFVLDVATEIEPLVAEKGLTLSLGIPASLPRVRTDPTHLRQILVNLLGNAVKFTEQGGIAVRAVLVDRDATPHPTLPPPGEAAVAAAPSVTPPDLPAAPGAPAPPVAAPAAVPAAAAVAAAPARAAAPPRRRPVARPPSAALPASAPATSRRWIAVQVADTGVGIAPTDYERIFDEFEQVGPRAGDSATRGTGLGLAISRRLARLLDGDLTVVSVAGEGSTFTLWLPVRDAT